MDFKYDVYGNRVQQAADTDGNAVVDWTQRYALDGWKSGPQDRFVGNENWDVWADLDGSSSLTTRYLRGDVVDQVFARVAADGTAAWLLTDRQGSVRDVTSNTGLLKDTIGYDGYGNVTSESDSAWTGRYTYTGRERDTVTGLYYYRERYLDGATARFLSQDPMGFGAGDSNLYRYVRNNPTGGTDPSGLQQPGSPGSNPSKQPIYGTWDCRTGKQVSGPFSLRPVEQPLPPLSLYEPIKYTSRLDLVDEFRVAVINGKQTVEKVPIYWVETDPGANRIWLGESKDGYVYRKKDHPHLLPSWIVPLKVVEGAAKIVVPRPLNYGEWVQLFRDNDESSKVDAAKRAQMLAGLNQSNGGLTLYEKSKLADPTWGYQTVKLPTQNTLGHFANHPLNLQSIVVPTGERLALQYVEEYAKVQDSLGVWLEGHAKYDHSSAEGYDRLAGPQPQLPQKSNGVWDYVPVVAPFLKALHAFDNGNSLAGVGYLGLATADLLSFGRASTATFVGKLVLGARATLASYTVAEGFKHVAEDPTNPAGYAQILVGALLFRGLRSEVSASSNMPHATPSSTPRTIAAPGWGPSLLNGREVYYRGMSIQEFQRVMGNGQQLILRTNRTEMFVSPSMGYVRRLASRQPQNYQVIVEFSLQAGTTSNMLAAGARRASDRTVIDAGLGFLPALESIPQSQRLSIIQFKGERGVINLGLRTDSMHLFNTGIDSIRWMYLIP